VDGPSPFSEIYDLPETTESTSCTKRTIPPSSLDAPMGRSDIIPMEEAKILGSEGGPVFTLVRELNVDLSNFYSIWQPLHYYNETKRALVVSGYVKENDFAQKTLKLPVKGNTYTIHYENTQNFWVSNILTAPLEGMSDIYPSESSASVMSNVSEDTAVVSVGFVDGEVTEFMADTIYIVHYE